MAKKKRKHKTARVLLLAAVLLAVVAAAAILPDKAMRAIYPVKYWDYVSEYSEQNGLDPYLVLAVIKVESNFNPDAISPKQARGLMQISEKTGQWGAKSLKLKDYSTESLYDPGKNIAIGCWYLGVLNKQYGGQSDLVLAAYNGGSGNVSEWLKDRNYSSTGKSLDKIPFKETENYLKRVKDCYSVYIRLYKK